MIDSGSRGWFSVAENAPRIWSPINHVSRKMIVTTSAVDDKRYILLSRNEFHEETGTTYLRLRNVWSETNFFKNCSMNASWSCRLNQAVEQAKSEDFYKQWLSIRMKREFRYIGSNDDDIDTARYLNERKSTEPAS